MSEQPREPLSASLREALDNAMLTHTGRSIGDLASERVIAEIMPVIHAEIERVRVAATTYVANVLEQRDKALNERNDALEIVRAVAELQAEKVTIKGVVMWVLTSVRSVRWIPAKARELLELLESPDSEPRHAK